MKIKFAEIYAEPGVHFEISDSAFLALNEHFNQFKLELPTLQEKFAGEFTLTLIISATQKADSLEVKGPEILRKRREAEFALFIPYKKFDSPSQEIDHVLSNIGEGIVRIFQSYKVSANGIAESISATRRTIAENG